MAANKNLNQAKDAKNDEFYTQLSDIEKELKNYKKEFENKIVFCNCDDPEWSNFWLYFKLNFDHLKLKKLISTHYDKNMPSYKLVLEKNLNNELTETKTDLKQNGDFRSEECIKILQECDIVVTNPPFSLFRQYIAQLIKYEKKFLVIGNMNACKYKEIFPLIKDNKLWYGYNTVKEFIKPDKTKQKFGNILWYTNLDTTKRHEDIVLFKQYTPEEYKKYDTYDAIEVSKVKLIPYDFDGVMGVPITFLNYYNPEQFEIIGEFNHGSDSDFDLAAPIIDGTQLYPRIAIKKKV